MASRKYTGQYRRKARRTQGMPAHMLLEAEIRNQQHPMGRTNLHCTQGLNGGRCSLCLMQTLRLWGVDVKAYFRQVAEDRREARKRWLQETYGMADPVYESMYAQQQGRCALCGEPETQHRQGVMMSLAIDHSHRTGEVRALLCQRCNLALGTIEALGLKWVREAVQYLKQHMSKSERERFTEGI